MQELAEKGIAPEITNEILEERYPPEKEKEIALKLAQTRLARYQNLDQDPRMRRTVTFLTRRGFNVSLAKSIVYSLEKGQVDQES